jgi:hypothetical protein
LNNLYKIKNKQGEVVTFQPNWAQRWLYNNMWYLNIILKARQLGMTTFIQIFMLDRALFNDHMSCGIIAHNKEDAKKFFDDKIKFAYDNLPADLRAELRAEQDTVQSLKFSNGSKIDVGTSMRSGTYQYLHVSEFGKMCAKYPEKAQEVITGSLNTLATGQIAFIESTAEGPFGEFYDMCKTAEDMTVAVENGDTNFTALDWKFFFFSWWQHPDYVLHEKVEIPDKLMTYFKELREEHGIDLRSEQKAWYTKKAAEQGDLMKQEYPATAAEAFERSTELSIYGKQLRDARRERRICKLPIIKGVPVNTFWDLGRNDVTAIWFHQHVEARHHFIYYLEGRLEELTFYVGQLQELKEEYKWFYGYHYLPHDVEVTDLSAYENKSRRQILQEAGLSPIKVVPKTRHLNDGIEITRRKFAECWFDEEGCELGLRALHGYEWAYDELHKVTRSTPAAGWARNGSDALRQFAQGFRDASGSWAAQAAQAGGIGATGRQYLSNKPQRGTPLNPAYDHVV